jgi:hypothetical protein
MEGIGDSFLALTSGLKRKNWDERGETRRCSRREGGEKEKEKGEEKQLLGASGRQVLRNGWYYN